MIAAQIDRDDLRWLGYHLVGTIVTAIATSATTYAFDELRRWQAERRAAEAKEGEQ